MNNRDYKRFAVNSISHVYNRGNNKEKVFLDEEDYRAFIFRMGLVLGLAPKELLNHELTKFPHSRIRINAKPNLFKLHSFCLMPNHFHLLVEQTNETPISKMILQLCTSFSMYFNKKYKRVGHVFQDCFKSVLVESNPQLMWNSAYIHMNPVAANLVDTPEKYPWSSYRSYTENENAKLPIVSKDLLLGIFETKENFIRETLRISKDSDPLSMSRGTLGF